MAASDNLHPDQVGAIIEGKLRAQAAWNEMTPELRQKTQAMKETALSNLSRMYLDLEHEDPSGRARSVLVPKGVDPGSHLSDWAAKNPPRKADYFTPGATKKKTHHA